MSELRTPVDDDARRRLRDEHRRTLFVEAGAGSGKTTQLVRRIEQLIVTGNLRDIGALAAITFTEAAAAELRVRLRDRLERSRPGVADGTPEADRIDAALDRLDDAAISTLHGFAYRLLAAHPLEAGLPPGFAIEDEIAAVVGDRERWTDFLDELFDDPEVQPAVRRALTLGFTLRQLNEVGKAFADNWDRIEAVSFPDHPLTAVDVSDIVAVIDEALDAAAACGDHRFPNAIRSALPELRRRLVAETDPEHQLLVLVHEVPAVFRPGTLPRDERIKALKGATDRLAHDIGGLLRTLRREALAPILARVRAFTLAQVDERCRQGRLRFHDLLVLARRLLASQPSVRARLANRFEVLLIDEFQDTDPLQVEIALLLGSVVEGDAPARWQDIEVGEGRLFFVGDPKQSIYRFRRADISIFEQVRDRFAPTGGVELTVNFRTVPSILTWVNAVFTGIIGDGSSAGQPAYRALEPWRAEPGPEPAVTLIGDEVAHTNVAALREAEAADVAATIARMRAEGWPVGDGDGTRPLRYRDVAVLLPTRAVLPELELALERAGVPYRIESRSLVYSTDVVRELLNVLAAVDDPGNEVAVVAALRSPGIACSDDDLARFRIATDGMTGARWNPATPLPDAALAELGADDPVVAGRAVLAALHERRHWSTVSALVGDVIEELRLVEVTTAHHRPRDHWRRLRMIQDEARAFVEAGGEALGDFIAYIEQQADERASRVETVVPEPDDDAVRILTVHGSKGLEFPAVVVAGLGSEYRSRYPNVLWTESGPEIALGPKGGARFETSGYQAAFDEDDDLERKEQDRLLYVAMTRARDQLVVSMHRQPVRGQGRNRSAASRIADVLAELDDATWRRLDPLPTDAVVAQPDGCTDATDTSHATAATGNDASGATLLAVEAAFAEARRAVLAAAARRAVLSPTGLASRARAAAEAAAVDDATDEPAPPDPIVVDDEGDREPPPDEVPPLGGLRRRTGGTAVGRAVHATLQLVDFDRGTDLEAVAQRAAATEGIEDRAGLVARLARAALASAPVAEARASGRWWRELFVSAPLGPAGTLVEGYVDLLYEDVDGNLVVVDYKTDQARDDDALDAAYERYRLQAATYAAVIGSALGRPVHRCVFVFARPSGPAAERTIDDVAAAVDEVVEALMGGATPVAP